MLRPLRDQPTRNVIQLGSAFFLLFVAFNSQGYIQEALFDSVSDRKKINRHAGYYGLALYYGVFTLCNLFIAPIIDRIGPRWAMVIGALFTMVYEAGFLYLDILFFYFSSALAGLGAALLWPAQGLYLTMNSSEETTERNSALLWAMSQSSQIAGGLILLFIFEFSSPDGHSISEEAIRWISICFTSLLLVSMVIFGTLRIPRHTRKEMEVVEKLGLKQDLVRTFKLLSSKRMLLLAIVFSYTGIEQSFWTSIYPTAISFTKQLGENTSSLVALSSVCSGMGQVVVCIWTARGSWGLSRRSVVVAGCVIHLVVFVGVHLNFPPEASIEKTANGGVIDSSEAFALFLSFLLGFGDGCWNTQVYTLLCDVYPSQSSQAFAIFNFYQSFWTATSLAYSSKILLSTHLMIMGVVAVGGAYCYWFVDQMGRIDYETPEGSREKVFSASTIAEIERADEQ